MNAPINVTIKQGDIQIVKMTGHPDLISKLRTAIVNDEWDIDWSGNFCITDSDVSIDITLPNIKGLKISGSGDIVVNDFVKQTALDIDIEGSGNFTLNKFEGITNLDVTIAGSGNVEAKQDISTMNTLTINIEGSGKYRGFALSSNDCTVNVEGSGDVELTAINSLNVNIEGSGDVSYKGNRTITQKSNGSGTLKDAN